MRIATRSRTDSRAATSHVLRVLNGRRRYEMPILKRLWKEEQGQDFNRIRAALSFDSFDSGSIVKGRWTSRQ
jgi:hypothetical protein